MINLRFIYTLLLGLFIPLIVLRLLWRSHSNPVYRQRIAERFAVIADPETPIKVWIHAVSVGETMAAKPLIEKLLAVYGDRAVMVSSTTPTGSDTVQRLFKNRVVHHYFPYDLPLIVNRYLRILKPDVLVCMETEIWPNLWHSCYQRNIPVILANARLSTRSKRRYQRFHKFVSGVLNNASLIACRNEQDAENFKAIGAQPHTVEVLGDIKSDIQVTDLDKQKARSFKNQWGLTRPVWVAASTHEGEDSLVLDMYTSLKSSINDLLLVIVPRHPERFSEVGKLIQSREFQWQSRSTNEAFSEDVEIVLGDSMGEMMSWYVAADVVFMGGSLVATGGHNPLEPLACGVPVISGPHVFNFKNTFEILEAEEAAFVAEDINELTDSALRLLENENLRRQAGEKGLAVIDKNKGATQRLVDEIQRLI
ncbi:MAG: lipid IV(A) 3-deoxy-D-manno-octulosonic acid transferase [Thiotrichaceae bacterium]